MPTDKLQILTPIVTSVNGQTGDVTVATKTSDLTNDSGFITASEVPSDDTKVDKVSGKGLSTNDYTTDEKNKLAGIETGANKTVVDSSISSTSTNPVQNKVVNTALSNKVDKVSGKGLSTNDLTNTLKSNYDAAYTHSASTHAPTDAEKNVIVGIQKNGTDVSINSSTRKVNITVPTSASDVGAVPTSRTVNGKALSSNITLSAADVDALPNSTAIITYDSLLPVEATTLINADTLNGHDSDYFATDTDVSGLQSNISGLQSNIDGLQTNVNDLQTNVNSLQTDANDLQSSVSTIMSDKLSKSGGTMIGELVAQNNSNYTVAQVRNIFISTTEPSGGGNGDIWLQYSE